MKRHEVQMNTILILCLVKTGQNDKKKNEKNFVRITVDTNTYVHILTYHLALYLRLCNVMLVRFVY